eukprot:TRINITY_DN10774_c0_g1_i1.p1 TRINITY_DN10774_c0_g1~~TRINITY_DN10774_c0_g1_i1.p1  ORF type:complete len:277 (-),score=69.24 TRINITY_DN10774_c0_g1_i1:57-827(-)
MYRNLYDNDITTWSPLGRLHQVEYAMEAVNHGSACVGVKSRTHAVICALKRSSSELSSFQKKVFKIDDHLGIAIAGLTADARVLCKFMRTEALNHRYVFDSLVSTHRLVQRVVDKCQVNTQRYGRRAYGVGLLVIGYDKTGSHLYETAPSGNYYDYKAQAIGARSQSSKTYLEKNFEKFDQCSLDQLIRHALFALREALSHTQKDDKEPETLNSNNVSVGIVGQGQPFKIIEETDLQVYLDALERDEGTEQQMQTD